MNPLPYRDQIFVAIAEAPESERLELAMYFIDRLTEVPTDEHAIRRLGFQLEPKRCRALVLLRRAAANGLRYEALSDRLGLENPRTLFVHICHLRRFLREKFPECSIVTLRGSAYEFRAPPGFAFPWEDKHSV